LNKEVINLKKTNVVTLDETNNVIEQFVDDIITYVNSGGDLENLTANNVYNVIKNKKEIIDDLSGYDNFMKVLPYLNEEDIHELLDSINSVKIDKRERDYILNKYDLSNDSKMWSIEEKVKYAKAMFIILYSRHVED